MHISCSAVSILSGRHLINFEAKGAGEPVSKKSLYPAASKAVKTVRRANRIDSAHVDTVGPQALDVFYVQEPGAGALSEQRAATVAHVVRAVLAGDHTALSAGPGK